MPGLRPGPEHLPGSGRILLAFSGGADSLCLLHLMTIARRTRELVSLHIDHGLHPGSGQRAILARDLAESLSVPCTIIKIDASGPGGPEAAARSARYTAIEQFMHPHEVVLVAHHAEDQVETVLLRLLRGAGPAGLAGMPRIRTLGPGWLARPLLDWTREEIDEYLERHGLEPIEDPSNRSLSHDRNFLRHRVLPLIRQHWPGASRALLRSAHLSAGAELALNELARIDLDQAREAAGCLRLEPLRDLPAFRLANLIRCWCAGSGFQPPPGDRLEAFIDQIQDAASDRIPEMCWDQAVLRRWNDRLWLEKNREPPATWRLHWSGRDRLRLPAELGELRIKGKGMLPTPVEVHPGQPGECIRLPGHDLTHRVKQLMAEHDVPPWQRLQWPRLSREGRLLAVGDAWIDAGFAAELEQHGLELSWHRKSI